MSQVIFRIDQKDYPIGCPDSQKERLEKLAGLVARKESEVVDIMGANISHDMLLVMIIVALSDELERLQKPSSDFSAVETELKSLIQFASVLKDSLK